MQRKQLIPLLFIPFLFIGTTVRALSSILTRLGSLSTRRTVSQEPASTAAAPTAAAVPAAVPAVAAVVVTWIIEASPGQRTRRNGTPKSKSQEGISI